MTAEAGAVAAVDLGATSGRVIVGRVGPDTLQTETVARFPNNPVRVGETLHWDILHLWGESLAGLRAAARVEPALLSIGVDSWAVDYGLLRAGRLLSNPVHYRDERTWRGVIRVHNRIRHPELFARNGLQYLPFNTVYQLASERGDFLDLADKLVLIPDLLGYWLTGKLCAERTNASTTGLLDIRSGQWDTELLDRLGLRRSLLPELVASGEVVGHVADATARAIGLSSPTAVTAVGSHDTASAVVAVPMTQDGAAYISCGTWGLVGVETEVPALTTAAREAKFSNEGGVDGRIRLLRNVMGLWVLSETVRGWEQQGHPIDLPTLLDSAAEVDARSVPLFDVDDPRFLRPGDMTARIDAWCDENSVAPPRARAEYTRSIIESLAEAFARATHQAAGLKGAPLSVIHIVGGGALSELLCQRTADRAGVPVIAGPVEATALGNLLVQARAVGLVHGSLESLRDLVARTQTLRRHRPQKD